MRTNRLLLAITFVLPCFGQLTIDQKLSDFTDLVAAFDRNYGPYEWKRDALHFDLLDAKSWFDRISATKNDLASTKSWSTTWLISMTLTTTTIFLRRFRHCSACP